MGIRAGVSHVPSSGPRKAARMDLRVVFVIFVNKVPKKNGKKRRRRCVQWQSSSGHCFEGMLRDDDGALLSDHAQIVKIRMIRTLGCFHLRYIGMDCTQVRCREHFSTGRTRTNKVCCLTSFVPPNCM